MIFEANPFLGLLRVTRLGCPRWKSRAFQFAFHQQLLAPRSL
jgi:hypothetical protein